MKITNAQQSNRQARHGLAATKEAARAHYDAAIGRAHLPIGAYMRRLRSCGYSNLRLVAYEGLWRVFDSNRGRVAVVRHLDGRWQVERREGTGRDGAGKEGTR